MDANYYKKYEPIFGSWYIKKKLGEGSFGKVYEIERNELGTTYKAALKALTIPQSDSEIKGIMADGMSYNDVTAYYEGVVGEIIGEFKLMSQLKGNSNIVSYEDHQLIKHEDGIGWDILIRMELLTPIFDYLEQNKMTKRDIIKMGIDLCKALELCQKYNIIHRDVKPENIFVSQFGDFKLGDFGIARTAEKTMSGMSRKGTLIYMAPEVFFGKAYNSTVDIYSLGLVMYRMLNDNRAPFFPAYPIPITHSDRENAQNRRLRGEEIPTPVNAEGRLAEIVLKACSFDPEKRYRSAAQMRHDLEEILYNEKEANLIYPDGDKIEHKSVEYKDGTASSEKSTEVLETIIGENQNQEKTEKIVLNRHETEDDDVSNVDTAISKNANIGTKKKGKHMLIAIGIVTVVVVLAIMMFSRGVKDITGIEDDTEIYIGESLSPEYIIEPSGKSTEKIEFSVNDDSIISVNESGKISAKEVGEAELIMKIGRYKETVNIIVKAKVTEIKNVSSQIDITEGNVKTISPILVPDKFSDCKIDYDIIDNDIATINSAGIITAKSPGTTKLVIKAGGCELTVKIVVKKYVAPQNTYKPKEESDPLEDLEMEVETTVEDVTEETTEME